MKSFKEHRFEQNPNDMNYEDFYKYITQDKDRMYYEDNYSFKLFTNNIMTLGYPSKSDESRILRYEPFKIKSEIGAAPILDLPFK